MKVDLTMWAKNGERYLPLVLRRIAEVIPQEVVAQRIFVDDGSTDRSREIAAHYGWDVYRNLEGWISGGIAEAIRHVKEEFFVSVEQDVLLASDWWDRIPKYMDDETVAIAQGIRISTNPTLRILEKEWIRRKNDEMLEAKTPKIFWSFDNNIFRTKIVQQLGIPTVEPLAVDYFFKRRLEQETEYRWIVDPQVVSDHIRNDILGHLKHHQRYLEHTLRREPPDRASILKMFEVIGYSPFVGLKLALKYRYPKLFVQYPFIELGSFHGYVVRRRTPQVVSGLWAE